MKTTFRSFQSVEKKEKYRGNRSQIEQLLLLPSPILFSTLPTTKRRRGDGGNRAVILFSSIFFFLFFFNCERVCRHFKRLRRLMPVCLSEDRIMLSSAARDFGIYRRDG